MDGSDDLVTVPFTQSSFCSFPYHNTDAESMLRMIHCVAAPHYNIVLHHAPADVYIYNIIGMYNGYTKNYTLEIIYTCNSLHVLCHTLMKKTLYIDSTAT